MLADVKSAPKQIGKATITSSQIRNYYLPRADRQENHVNVLLFVKTLQKVGATYKVSCLWLSCYGNGCN